MSEAKALSFPSEEKVLADVRSLQYLYGLKHEIRYAEKRTDDDYTESVAEHVYGMHILTLFFLPLIAETKEIDRERVFSLITVHDLDEIETGDMLGYLKTDAIRASEVEAAKRVVAKAPAHLQDSLQELAEEYNNCQTLEARFVKAIDKFEPLIHLYNESGKRILQNNKTTLEQSIMVKESYLKPFPIMFHYYEYLHDWMIKEDFFHHES